MTASRHVFTGLLIVILLAGPPAAWPQPPGKSLPRVALVIDTPPVAVMLGPDPRHPHVRAFVHALRDLGWIEGQTVVIERRSAEGQRDRAPDIFADLVRLKVDAIVTISRLAGNARQATSTIPIVMAAGYGLVGQGFAASLARPGGNLTGVDLEDTPDVNAKRVQLLKEIAPRVSRIGFLGSPRTVDIEAPKVQAQLQSAGVTLFPMLAETDEQLTSAFAAVSRDRLNGLVVMSAFAFSRRSEIAAYGRKNRLPAVAYDREFAESGLLMTYGASVLEGYRKAAGYVDRILRGARPGELPIQRASTFDLVVNETTARSLGLTIPPSVLALAQIVP
jgi:ABC-type uncharacterized transport system substrate-binding protein